MAYTGYSSVGDRLTISVYTAVPFWGQTTQILSSLFPNGTVVPKGKQTKNPKQ